jgi:hypothetical protein
MTLPPSPPPVLIPTPQPPVLPPVPYMGFLHQQLDTLSNSADSSEGVIIKEIVKGVVVPGALISGAFGVSYVLMFSQVLYDILLLLLGVGASTRKLDPAVLLEYWEDENKKRDDDQNKLAERMFV